MRRLLQFHRASLLIFVGLALLLGWGWRRWQGMTPAVGAQILYLGWDEAGLTQLFRMDAMGTAVTPLTHDANGIANFAVSPDGARIAYRTLPPDVTEAGGHAKAGGHAEAGGQIWVMDRNGRHARKMLTCAEFTCLNPLWAPDNERLIYERRLLPQAAALPAAPHIWWLDSASGDTYPVLVDDHAIGAAASLSPDGQWISFFAPETGSTELYNFDDGRHFLAANQIGDPVVWHPAHPWFLLRNLAAVAGLDDNEANVAGEDRHTNLGVHLFLVDVNAQEWTELSADTIVDDAAPAWSPDGEWIAFGRRPARTDLGRQLWLMRADGRQARALTDDVTAQYGPPNWSADGRFLLFQRYDTTNPGAQPGIWLLEIATGQQTEIAPAGFLPIWLP